MSAFHEIAVDVLRSTDNPAVMWGDAGLLDMMWRRKHPEENYLHPLTRWKRVLDALSRSHGILKPCFVSLPNGRLVRCFYLPERYTSR